MLFWEIYLTIKRVTSYLVNNPRVTQLTLRRLLSNKRRNILSIITIGILIRLRANFLRLFRMLILIDRMMLINPVLRLIKNLDSSILLVLKRTIPSVRTRRIRSNKMRIINLIRMLLRFMRTIVMGRVMKIFLRFRGTLTRYIRNLTRYSNKNSNAYNDPRTIIRGVTTRARLTTLRVEDLISKRVKNRLAKAARLVPRCLRTYVLRILRSTLTSITLTRNLGIFLEIMDPKDLRRNNTKYMTIRKTTKRNRKDNTSRRANREIHLKAKNTKKMSLGNRTTTKLLLSTILRLNDYGTPKVLREGNRIRLRRREDITYNYYKDDDKDYKENKDYDKTTKATTYNRNYNDDYYTGGNRGTATEGLFRNGFPP